MTPGTIVGIIDGLKARVNDVGLSPKERLKSAQQLIGALDAVIADFVEDVQAKRARIEKAEAEVARLTAKLAQLPLDIADTLLAQADHLQQRFGGDQPRITGRIGGLQEAAHMARRFAEKEAPDA